MVRHCGIDRAVHEPSSPGKSRWWRISLIVLGALVLLLAIGYVALTRMFPPARLAEMLAREVQAATGRELRIDGGLSLRVLPTIAVVADDLAFGNAAWGSRKEMATVKRAAFELAIAPLLQGQLHVLSLTVEGVDVLLETDPRGRPNWIFSEAKSKGPSATSGDEAPPPVHLDRLQVSNARIAYRIGLTRVTRTIDIESLQILHQGGGAVLSTRFGGQQRQWRLDAKTGRYEALVRNTADWPFEAQLTTDGAKVTATGSLDTAGTERATLTVKVDKAAALEPLLADAAALPMPIEASAKVQRSAALLTADALRLSIAGQLLTGKVAVHTDQAVPRIDMDLAAQSIDLAQWGIKRHATATTPATKTPGRLFTDTPLPTITLPEYPLHANVRIDRLVVPDLPPLSAVKAEIKVEPERLVVEPLSVVLAGAPVRARIELGVAPRRAAARETARRCRWAVAAGARGARRWRRPRARRPRQPACEPRRHRPHAAWPGVVGQRQRAAVGVRRVACWAAPRRSIATSSSRC